MTDRVVSSTAEPETTRVKFTPSLGVRVTIEKTQDVVCSVRVRTMYVRSM